MRKAFRGGAALLAAIAAAFCASPASAEQTLKPAISPPTSLLNTVKAPAANAKTGKFVVCTELGNPPADFLADDGVTLQGFNIDVIDALGPVMGIKSEVVTLPFASIFAALDTDKCDAVMSTNSKSAARVAKYNFVEYMRIRIGLLVPTGNPFGIKTFQDLSGKRAAVLLSSTSERVLKEASDRLEAQGKPGIERHAYPENAVAFRDLGLGRVDAFVSDAMTLAYFKSLGADKFIVGGLPGDNLVIGIVLRKDEPELQQALYDAYYKLYSAGFVDASAKRWGMEGIVDLCNARDACQ
jgi:polar amino acid transport system substrate-binding protein